MRRSGRFAVAAMVIIALCVGLALLVDDAGDPGGRDAMSDRNPPSRTRALDCKDRVDGPRLSSLPERDLVMGPVAFLGARGVFRATTGPRPGENDGMPHFDGRPMKVLALVASGRRVTITVPAEQRRWLRLLYEGGGRATTSITLQACRRVATPRAIERECRWSPHMACRWRNTQFAGGFAVAHTAPERGLCAQLRVRADGERQPMRAALFARPNACPRLRQE
jgi:hypothetical protein